MQNSVGSSSDHSSRQMSLEHNIEAYYSAGPGEPYYQPVIGCSCGFSSGRCKNWEEAGEAMDRHIREITASRGAERGF